jgi:hypothetical protein
MPAGATYEPIATSTVAVAAASITFSSIPSTYTDLRIVLTGKCDYISQSYGTILINFNGDTAANYGYQWIYGDGTSATSSTGSAMTGGRLYFGADISASSWATMATVDVFSYTSSAYKAYLHTHSNDANGGAGAGINVGNRVLVWKNNAAITSIVLSNLSFTNYAVGTTATLYGIKAA